MNVKDILDDIRRNAGAIAREAADLQSDPRYRDFLDESVDRFLDIRGTVEQLAAELNYCYAKIAASADERKVRA